ncbi:MAG: hypothetical protein JJT93_16260, partial [Gammaproteobacteria bacterium]|nr:hypothetical protein [Gammaproteobacteria bacterium]
MAAYGDSFTWGAEVDADQAYPAVLSTLLGCRVDNFGVGGYGTDQALIRYKMNSSDVAETVLLGHFSDNIVRNVNQLRDLYAYSRFGFKPRFILSQTGELVLVPLPHLGRDDYLRLYENVEELLPHEFFAPNSAGAAFVMGFPYSRTVLRALSHYRVRYILRDEPSYQGFYNPTHESHALAVTGAILLRFVKEVQNRSQVGHILLIPDIKDLHSLSRHGSAAYDPLVEFLAVHNVAAIDVGRLILQQHPAVDPCEWYTRCRGSHFNAD